jgi:ketosteroid isomerase-like protein
MELKMREIALVVVLVVGWMAPAFAQKAEIEAANAKWIELFNKGDYSGVAALYTADASGFLRALQSCAGETRSAPCGKAWQRRSAIPSSSPST